MAPAVGQPHRAALGQALVGRVAVDLEHACKPAEMRDWPSGRAIRGVDVGDAGWIRPAPGPVVTRIRPKLAGLGAAASWIEHGCRGLVGKQLARKLQRLQEPLVHGPKQEGGTSDPIGQRRAVEADDLAGEDWHLLTRGEDHAWVRPALHAKKSRELKLRSGEPARRGQRGAAYAYNLTRVRQEKRRRMQQAEVAYRRMTEGWS